MDEKIIIFTKALADPTRLKILNRLKRECCVGELWEKLSLPQNLVSHHLRVLKEAELITSEKRGMRVVYRLNDKSILKNVTNLEKYLT